MRLIVVTGATKGLGFAISKHLASQGYKVVGIGRSLSPEYKELLDSLSDQVFFEPYDFNDVKGIQEMVRSITSKHGHIYGLVNNAALGFDGVLGTMHESEISELIRVNIEAPILLTKYVSRSMLLKREGRIVNISSIIASTGFNGLSVYAATKAALTGFTKSLARELGRAGITVNTVSPGYMDTNMTKGIAPTKLATIVRRSPLNRLATVDDVAAFVHFLISDNGKNTTGTNMTIDAGSTS